jgi:hypothetical protein
VSIPADLIDQARRTPIERVVEQHGLRLKRSGAELVGACPRCGGQDRFAINWRKQLFNCRGCNAKGDAIALEQHITSCSFAEAIERLSGERISRAPPSPINDRPRPIATAQGNVDAGDDRMAAALALWAAGVDPRGTLVERYLASRWLDLDSDIAGEVIRWHPGAGAMLALFRDIRTDEPRAVSRTYLDKDARKIERRFLGPVGGCAIKLDADDAVLSGLHIGEGVESAMAARQLKMRPCWALGSKGAIGAFQVLAGVESLTILAEPDAERETEACAFRWHSAGREVFFLDAVGGGDANDVLLRRGTS